MTVLVASDLGAAVGLVVGLVLLRRSAIARAEALLQAWQAEEGRDISAEAAAGARLGVKARLATLDGLDVLAADSRWVGDPVWLVVFDGDSEVKAGAADELRAVTFVIGSNAQAEAELPAEEQAVAECVEAGRIRWVTLRLPAAG